MSQDVVVYRNPGEKAIWEFLASGAGFTFMTGLVTFIVAHNLLEKIPAVRKNRFTRSWLSKVPMYGAGAVTLIVAIFWSRILQSLTALAV